MVRVNPSHETDLDRLKSSVYSTYALAIGNRTAGVRCLPAPGDLPWRCAATDLSIRLPLPATKDFP